MSASMTCTKCHRDTGCEAPATEDMPVEVVIALATGWLCDGCLDELEAVEPGSTSEGGGA